MDRRFILLAFAAPCPFLLPLAVHAADDWRYRPDDPAVWLGAVGGVACVVLLEIGYQLVGDLWDEEVRTHPPDWPGAKDNPVALLRTAVVVLTQLVTIFLYALKLDGHVSFAAVGWVCPAFHISAAALLVARPTGWFPQAYRRWGWAPLVAFGLPLALPVLLDVGLVRGPLG